MTEKLTDEVLFVKPTDEEVAPNPVKRVRVLPPFQAVHEGIVYRPGDTADVPEHVAAHWITNGWVVNDDSASDSQASTSSRHAK